MVSGFFTSPCDQSRIFCGAASLMRIAPNVMGFGCRSRRPHRSLTGLSSRTRLPKGRSVSILWISSSGRLLAVFGDELDVEGEALQFLDEHVEGLRRAGLQEILALHDGLVDPVAALHVVGLHGEHLLQGMRGAVCLECPHL